MNTESSQLEMKALAPHKEDGAKRRELDECDWNNLSNELKKHSHPLIADSKQLYNIVNGQYVPTDVNVCNAVENGKKQAKGFVEKLPNGYHNSIKKQVKTMQHMKKAVVVKGKAIYDMETPCCRSTEEY